jgi:hypothetical protein
LNRRIATLAVLLAIMGLVTYWSWQYAHQKGRSATDVWNLVPSNAVFVIELPSAWLGWDRITRTSKSWEALRQRPVCAAMDSLFQQAAVRADKVAGLLRVARKPLTLALCQVGPGSLELLVLLNLPEGNDVALYQAMAELLRVDGDFAQGTFTALPSAEIGRLHGALRSDVLLLASHPLLLTQAQEAPTADRPGMAPARASFGAGADAHVLVHARNLQALAHQWSPNEARAAEPWPEGWLALDLTTRPESLLLNGSFFPRMQGTAAHYLSTSKNNVALRVLPATANTFQWGSVTGAPTLGEGLTGEWAWGVGSRPGDSLSTNEWGVLVARDSAAAQKEMDRLARDGVDTAAGKWPIALVHFIHNSSALCGEAIGRCVLMASDSLALQHAQQATVNGATVTRDARYARFAARTIDGAGFTWWCDVARSIPLVHRYLDPYAADAVGPWLPALAQLGAFTVQATPQASGPWPVAVTIQHGPVEHTVPDPLGL